MREGCRSECSAALKAVNVLRQAVLRLRLPNKGTEQQELLAGNTGKEAREGYGECAGVSIEGDV
jgi:hypothetical protein